MQWELRQGGKKSLKESCKSSSQKVYSCIENNASDSVVRERQRQRAPCLFLSSTGLKQNPKPLVYRSNAPEPISISFPKPQTSCGLQQCSCPYLPLFAIALRVFCFTKDVPPRRKNTSSLGAPGTINGSQNANTAGAASLENCLPADDIKHESAFGDDDEPKGWAQKEE